MGIDFEEHVAQAKERLVRRPVQLGQSREPSMHAKTIELAGIWRGVTRAMIDKNPPADIYHLTTAARQAITDMHLGVGWAYLFDERRGTINEAGALDVRRRARSKMPDAKAILAADTSKLRLWDMHAVMVGLRGLDDGGDSLHSLYLREDNAIDVEGGNMQLWPAENLANKLGNRAEKGFDTIVFGLANLVARHGLELDIK